MQPAGQRKRTHLIEVLEGNDDEQMDEKTN